MSQTVITSAFEQLKAQEAANGGVVILDEFVFANVPNLDITSPIDRGEGLPDEALIVHRQAVGKTGMVNNNAVVYSVVMGADVGDFEFNWVGLVNKANNVVAMIVHAPTQKKIKTATGQQGNVLTRSFLMEYNGASEQTQIITPADTWQIDFTARLNGVDERVRLENIDLYGSSSFLDDGFLVRKEDETYTVNGGLGYVAGIRAELLFKQELAVNKLPVKVWADVSWRGTLTSEWAASVKIRLAESMEDYHENDEYHFVSPLAEINSDGTVTDLRSVSVVDSLARMRPEKNKIPYFNEAAKLRLSPVYEYGREFLQSETQAEALLSLGLSESEKGAKVIATEYGYNVGDYLYPCPDDFFVGAFFDNDKNKSIYLVSSPDGTTFYRLNASPMAGINANATGRDPSILYYDGYWYIAYTGSENMNNLGDFTIMRSRDLISWKSFPVKAYGSSVIYKQPGSVIGGSISSIKDVWGPSLYVADNTIYAILIVSYNDDTTDIDGKPIGWQVPVSLRCNNVEKLTFDLPKLLLNNQSVPRLDTEVIFNNGNYYAVVKNEYTKKIELWRSVYPDQGFTQINTIDFGLHVEGPSLVYNNARELWYIYADAYELQGTYYYATSPDLTSWSAAKKVNAEFQMRHGSVLNLVNGENPVSAIESFKTASALQHAQGVMQQMKIAGVQYMNASASLAPQQDMMYAVTGSTDITLTLPVSYKARECTVFYVMKASQARTGGITVTGPMVNGTFKVGYSDSNLAIFAFILDPSSNKYSCMGVSSFDGLRGMNNTWTGTHIFTSTVDVDQWLNIGQSRTAPGLRRLAFYPYGDGNVGAFVQGTSGGELHIGGNAGIGSSSNIYPVTSDSALTLGKATNLWEGVFAKNSSINTSDARMKTRPRSINEDEVSAFYEIGNLPMVWQWLDKYRSEGDEARLHSGPTVQDAIDVMGKYGLDWKNYAAFCYDRWEAVEEITESVPEIKDDAGNILQEGTVVVTQQGREAGDRYSFRKEELLSWILRAVIAKNKSIEDRLSALESGKH
ncbi:phage tail-collar fiber domain-containing protein [Klebsiella michiganensis]